MAVEFGAKLYLKDNMYARGKWRAYRGRSTA